MFQKLLFAAQNISLSQSEAVSYRLWMRKFTLAQ